MKSVFFIILLAFAAAFFVARIALGIYDIINELTEPPKQQVRQRND